MVNLVRYPANLAQSGCFVAIFLREHMIKRLTTMKRQEMKSRAG